MRTFLDYIIDEREKGVANRNFEIKCTKVIKEKFADKIKGIKTSKSTDGINSDIQVELKDGTMFQIECKNIHGNKGTQAGYGNKVKLQIVYIPSNNSFKLNYIPTQKKHSFTANAVNDFALDFINERLQAVQDKYSSSVLQNVFNKNNYNLDKEYTFNVFPTKEHSKKYSSLIQVNEEKNLIMLPANPSAFDENDDADDIIHFIADVDKSVRKYFQDFCLLGKDKANRDYTESDLIGSNETYKLINYWYKHKSEHTTTNMPVSYIIASDSEQNMCMYLFPFAKDYLNIGKEHQFTPESGRFTTQINLYTRTFNQGTNKAKTLVNTVGKLILYVRWKIMKPNGFILQGDKQ